ncbi:hypothetical protein DLJ48_08655 [Oenococcus sicerae]|uniref:Uncharacterized protein n=1 Tax=Oenococcus sicerae TaxID=2203724 RepID=A0ABX6J1L3_9LACO|nr:hypothetical protein [Oenococcus sicerae]QHW12507.1 hypothetical protein DLJ48_08655 [Oenococcus sicerae]
MLPKGEGKNICEIYLTDSGKIYVPDLKEANHTQWKNVITSAAASLVVSLTVALISRFF